MKRIIIFLGLVFLLSDCNLKENKGETEKAATVDTLAENNLVDLIYWLQDASGTEITISE